MRTLGRACRENAQEHLEAMIRQKEELEKLRREWYRSQEYFKKRWLSTASNAAESQEREGLKSAGFGNMKFVDDQ